MPDEPIDMIVEPTEEVVTQDEYSFFNFDNPELGRILDEDKPLSDDDDILEEDIEDGPSEEDKEKPKEEEKPLDEKDKQLLEERTKREEAERELKKINLEKRIAAGEKLAWADDAPEIKEHLLKEGAKYQEEWKGYATGLANGIENHFAERMEALAEKYADTEDPDLLEVLGLATEALSWLVATPEAIMMTGLQSSEKNAIDLARHYYENGSKTEKTWSPFESEFIKFAKASGVSEESEIDELWETAYAFQAQGLDPKAAIDKAFKTTKLDTTIENRRKEEEEKKKLSDSKSSGAFNRDTSNVNGGAKVSPRDLMKSMFSGKIQVK